MDRVVALLGRTFRFCFTWTTKLPFVWAYKLKLATRWRCVTLQFNGKRMSLQELDKWIGRPTDKWYNWSAPKFMWSTNYGEFYVCKSLLNFVIKRLLRHPNLTYFCTGIQNSFIIYNNLSLLVIFFWNKLWTEKIKC